MVQSVAAPTLAVTAARGRALGRGAVARAGATNAAGPASANRLTPPPSITASVLLTTPCMPSAYPPNEKAKLRMGGRAPSPALAGGAHRRRRRLRRLRPRRRAPGTDRRPADRAG